jgi:hypothetical protein
VLVGKSRATHQIDVFWQFEIAGQLYQTCVECKHYSTSVKKSHVAAFAAILDDIGNTNGIFVTTEGYQAGAKLFAEQKNIRLFRFNPVINQIEIDAVLQVPHVDNFAIEIDLEASKAVLKAAGRETYTFAIPGHAAVLRHEATGELHDITVATEKLGEPGPTRIDLSGYAIQTEVGWFPLKAASFDLSFSEMRETISIKSDDPVLGIIEDVLANTRFYVDAEGRKRPAPDADASPAR